LELNFTRVKVKSKFVIFFTSFCGRSPEALDKIGLLSLVFLLFVRHYPVPITRLERTIDAHEIHTSDITKGSYLSEIAVDQGVRERKKMVYLSPKERGLMVRICPLAARKAGG
jgi:hypothetical protein